MKITPRIIILLMTLGLSEQSLKAQSVIINEMINALTELTGSFMENPYHHSNTLEIYDLTQQFKEVTDNAYSEVLYSNSRVDSDLLYLKNMKGILKCLDFITASVAGYIKGGIDATEWEATFNPIMTEFGWRWKVLYSTEQIVFYEYSKDNFRMVLAKNILPKKDIEDYNAVAYSCDSWDSKWRRYTTGVRRIVFGGNYQFVIYGDDETEYKSISKVSSKRGSNINCLK